MRHQQKNSLNKPSSKVIQEIVSPEISKLNHVLTNKKKGDQMQFSQKKNPFIHSCQLTIGVGGLYYIMW